MLLQVLVDGTNIKELDLHWLRSHMAIVSQEPSLFTVWHSLLELPLQGSSADACTLAFHPT